MPEAQFQRLCLHLETHSNEALKMQGTNRSHTILYKNVKILRFAQDLHISIEYQDLYRNKTYIMLV